MTIPNKLWQSPINSVEHVELLIINQGISHCSYLRPRSSRRCSLLHCWSWEVQKTQHFNEDLMRFRNDGNMFGKYVAYWTGGVNKASMGYFMGFMTNNRSFGDGPGSEKCGSNGSTSTFSWGIWWCSGFGAFRGPTGTKGLFLTGWAASDGNFHTIAALLAHPQGIKPCRYPDARNRCYTLLAPMDCIAWWQPANHPHHEWLCYEARCLYNVVNPTINSPQ